MSLYCVPLWKLHQERGESGQLKWNSLYIYPRSLLSFLFSFWRLRFSVISHKQRDICSDSHKSFIIKDVLNWMLVYAVLKSRIVSVLLPHGMIMFRRRAPHMYKSHATMAHLAYRLLGKYFNVRPKQEYPVLSHTCSLTGTPSSHTTKLATIWPKYCRCGWRY